MLFSTTLTVPAGTLTTAPAEAALAVQPGIIHQVDVTFLDGPENEVHVALRSSGVHQIVPTNSGSIVGNARTVTASLRYPIEEPPHKVVLQAWSPDATYAHEVAVDVHVFPREVLEPPQEGLGILHRLKTAILGGP